MLLDLVLDTAPTAELVTVAQLKAQVGVLAEDTSDDTLLAACLAAAVGHLDGYAGVLGRALASQVWKLYLDAWPCDRIVRLPLPPLISVGSVSYLAADTGLATTLASTEYQVLDGERAQLRPAYGKTFPSLRTTPRAVTITFTCGWAAPSGANPWPSKLQPAIAAIKLIAAGLYANREPTIPAELAASTALKDLLRPLRLPKV
jgi:uncharacterized phiE125 gp8 family phage protein